MSFPGDDRNKRIDDAEAYELPPETQEEQLTLADENEKLPWLESDEDEVDEGVNTGMIVLVALAGLVLILGVIGAFWLLGRDGDGGEVLADGSTIAAPEEPYKSRPEDAGGIDVAGTGDESFAQGEGQTRDAQIAADDAPRPSIDLAQGDEPAPAADATTGVTGVGVQVGAYLSRAAAQEGWGVLTQRYSALSGLNRRIVEAQVDGSTVYRLQAVAADEAGAQAACASIKSAGGDCAIKR